MQEADLAANDAYHRKVEELSRTVWAPAKEGVQRQTHWFYERARGQYLNEHLRAGTDAKIREFESMFPKPQLFTKTDLAKVMVTWHLRPDIVSKGAQACFLWFMTNLDKIETEEGKLDAQGFERIAAKLILYRCAERIIKNKDMPFEGYWANIVTYTVARLVCETKNLLDMGRIWKEQKISPGLETAINDISKQTYSHIIAPYGGANVTQYCKQQNCWNAFLDRDVYLSETVRAETLSGMSGSTARIRANAGTIAVHEKNKRVMAVDAQQWFAIHTWAKDIGALNGIQLEQVVTFAEASGSGTTLSPGKAKEAAKILDMVVAKGYTLQ